MDLSPEKIRSLCDWRQRTSKSQSQSLGEIQELLDLRVGRLGREDYDMDGHFAYPPNPADFDPDLINDELPEERYRALIHGADPTKEELELWTDRMSETVFENDAGWFHFYLWRVDLPNETIYFRTLHGDGGIMDTFHGPYSSIREALDEAATVAVNPR